MQATERANVTETLVSHYIIIFLCLPATQRLEWFSSETGVSRCRLKGKSEEDCQNYIRVMARKSSDVLFVCGTNAFSPACRNYTIKGASTSSWYEPLGLEGPGEGLCPYGPKYNLVTTFAGTFNNSHNSNTPLVDLSLFSPSLSLPK